MNGSALALAQACGEINPERVAAPGNPEDRGNPVLS